MTLKTRRFIYIFFILIFLVTAPALIVYAMGYRYNFKKSEFQKTGSLAIDSLPKDLDVYLDNELYKDKTPTRINNLLPGEYQIKLDGEGYYPWQKKLTVSQEVVTFVKKVVLFKKDQLPVRLIEKPILASLPDSQNQKIASLVANDQENEIWLTELSNQTNQVLNLEYQPGEDYELLGWSASNKKLLVKKTSKSLVDYLVIQAEKGKSNDVTNLLSLLEIPYSGKEIIKASWDARNDNYLYLQTANEFYKINLASSQVETLKLKTTSDWLAIDKVIYYIDNGYLIKYANDKKENIVKLPTNQKYQFINHQNNLLALNEPTSQNTLIISPDQKEITLDIKAKGVFWSDDNKMMLYYNDLEMWVYYPEDQSKELITRYSQPLKEVIWYPTYNYLIFSQKTDNNQDKLVIIELDSRDFRNTIELPQAENINHLIVGSKAENLFYTAKIGNQEGLYSLNIH